MGDYLGSHPLQRFVQKKVGGKTPPQLIFVYPKDSVIYRPLALDLTRQIVGFAISLNHFIKPDRTIRSVSLSSSAKNLTFALGKLMSEMDTSLPNLYFEFQLTTDILDIRDFNYVPCS